MSNKGKKYRTKKVRRQEQLEYLAGWLKISKAMLEFCGEFSMLGVFPAEPKLTGVLHNQISTPAQTPPHNDNCKSL